MADRPRIRPPDGLCLCSTCGKQYTEVRNLNRHIRKEHPDELLKDVPESGVRVQPTSSCSTCGKQYTQVKNLNRHIRKEHPDELLKNVQAGDTSEITSESRVRVQPTFLCSTCGKQYTEASNLNRHIRKEHPDELLKNVHAGDTGEITSESRVRKQPTSSCATCGKQYTEVKNLTRHIRKEHPDELLKEGQDGDTIEITRVKCEICDKTYKGSKQMHFHMKSDHQTDLTHSALPTLCCPMHCDAKFINCKQLDDHLTVEHGVSVESTVMEFDSIAEFESWKAGLESTTLSSFVKHSVTATKLYYYCHRSGVPRTQYAERIQWTPTIKTGKCCPARITVKRDERTQKLHVTHYQTHVGHTQSIKYMKLNKDERSLLAGKIESGVPFDRILDDVRSTVENYGEIKRLHILEKQDLRNIVQEFRLDRDRVHTNDAFSVDTWVQQQKEYGKDCPIIYYKPQDCADEQKVLKKEDFMMVLMTQYQKEIALEYASQKVCIDSTHGTTGHNFMLTTLVSVDEFGAGTPIVECISNRIDAVAMAEFFKAVKQNIGHIPCKVFMSDDYPAYFNAWTQVMGAPEHRLLCAWHIDKNWRENLSKVKNALKRPEVYKACRVLLEVTDKADFHNTMTDFLKSCSEDEDTVDFGGYFKKHYGGRPEQWAFAFRCQLGINTNMYLEALHKKLKYCYMDGKVNRRVDKLVTLLLQYTRDIMFERTVRMLKNKPTYRMKAIASSHKRSVNITDDMIEFSDTTDQEWVIKSSSNPKHVYKITINSDGQCAGCPLSCPECKVCVHQFTCTCVDFLIRANMCKHVHACIRMRQKISNQTLKKDIPLENNGDEAYSRHEEVVVKTMQCQPHVHIGEGVTTYYKVQQVFNAALNVEKTLSCEGKEQMWKETEKYFQKIQALSSQFPNDGVETSAENVPKFDKNEVTSNHKNIIRQRFYSTKKKSNKKDETVRLSKPTALQKVMIKQVLKDTSEEQVEIHNDFDHKYS